MAENFMRSAIAPTISAGRDDREHHLIHREDVVRYPVGVISVRGGIDAIAGRRTF